MLIDESGPAIDTHMPVLTAHDFADTMKTTIQEPMGPELITNGDFETYDALNAGNWGNFQNIDGWNADQGLIDILKGQHFGLGETAADNSYLELDSGSNATVTQTVTVAEAGMHHLNFDYAHRFNGAQTSETSSFEVLVNGEVVATLSSDDIDWQNHLVQIDLPAGENQISFRGTGSEDGWGALIDNVSLKKPTQVELDKVYTDERNDELKAMFNDLMLDSVAQSYEWKAHEKPLKNIEQFAKGM